MLSIDSDEDLRFQHKISLLVGLWFVEDGEFDLEIDNPINGDMVLPKSYFEADLKLSLPPLFRDVVISLHLTPN